MSTATKWVLVFTLLLIVVAVIVVSQLGCQVEQSNSGLTLEQKGLLVRTLAATTLQETHIASPGLWKDQVCSLATIIVKALDGDEQSLNDLGLLGTDTTIAVMVASDTATHSSITIGTKNFLLDLLQLTAVEYGLPKTWENRLSNAILLFDAFFISGIITEYEVWFLTREFFVGISKGCEGIND